MDCFLYGMDLRYKKVKNEMKIWQRTFRYCKSIGNKTCKYFLTTNWWNFQWKRQHWKNKTGDCPLEVFKWKQVFVFWMEYNFFPLWYINVSIIGNEKEKLAKVRTLASEFLLTSDIWFPLRFHSLFTRV